MKRERVIVRLFGPDTREGDRGPLESEAAWSAKVWPRMADRGDGRGEVPIDGQNIALPAGAIIDSTAEVELRGELYEVDGVPALYSGKAVIAALTRVGG